MIPHEKGFCVLHNNGTRTGVSVDFIQTLVGVMMKTTEQSTRTKMMYYVSSCARCMYVTYHGMCTPGMSSVCTRHVFFNVAKWKIMCGNMFGQR